MDYYSEVSGLDGHNKRPACSTVGETAGTVILARCRDRFYRYLCQTPDTDGSHRTQSQLTTGSPQAWPALPKVNINITAIARHGSRWNPVSCPNGHLTHAFLACDMSTICCAGSDVTFSFSPDTWALPTSQMCLVQMAMTPLPPSFLCGSEEQRVPYSLVCDHHQHCADGSDETFCKFLPCKWASQFECMNKQVRTVCCLGLNNCPK